VLHLSKLREGKGCKRQGQHPAVHHGCSDLPPCCAVLAAAALHSLQHWLAAKRWWGLMTGAQLAQELSCGSEAINESLC
jgi:hypothetical protein